LKIQKAKMTATTGKENPLSLFSTPILQIVPKDQKLITIDSKTDILAALKILTEANIYSAPVYDAKNDVYCGFIDLLDVVFFLVSTLQQKVTGVRDQLSFFESVQSLDLRSAKNLVDLSTVTPMCPISPTACLSEAMQIFADTGAHRVPILQSKSTTKIANVLTQSAVIGWLSSNVNLLGKLRHKTLKELGIQTKKVHSVEISKLCFDALQLMVENRITAVAVVNPDGSLLSNLSAKDIKEVISDDLLTYANKTTLQLVQAVRSKDINVKFPAFSCHLSTTLEEAIIKLGWLKVHRLWIVDELSYPIGVLTIGDIFKLIVPVQS